MSIENPAPQEPAFQSMDLDSYPDVTLRGATLYDLVCKFGSDGKLDYTGERGNRIICEGTRHEASMRNTRIYFGGARNTIKLGQLKGVSRLDIACIGSSKVTVGRNDIVRGVTIMASTRAEVTIGPACMMSRDIMIYASGAHGLFSSVDGTKRGSANIQIGKKVWLGQGVRILSGAHVGEGSVIGSYSVLAGKVPNNCAAAGNPCRVRTRNIFWVSDTITDNYFEHRKKAGLPLPNFVQMTEEE